MLFVKKSKNAVLRVLQTHLLVHSCWNIFTETQSSDFSQVFDKILQVAEIGTIQTKKKMGTYNDWAKAISSILKLHRTVLDSFFFC